MSIDFIAVIVAVVTVVFLTATTSKIFVASNGLLNIYICCLKPSDWYLLVVVTIQQQLAFGKRFVVAEPIEKSVHRSPNWRPK